MLGVNEKAKRENVATFIIERRGVVLASARHCNPIIIIITMVAVVILIIVILIIRAWEHDR